MSDHDGVSRGKSVCDQHHCPISHALHDDSYGPQLYIWPCLLAIVVKWQCGG